MIDADQLRVINETHGQACGDAVLVHLTRLVNATLRQYDLMARFNAGVLVVYLPHTDPIGAIDVAERIRERIANFRMAWPTGSVAVTVSVGVASIGADHSALDTVISDAGAALRKAKAAGRNCVRAAPVPPKRNPANGVSQGDRRIRGSN
jgi:diguanylate cyclase (GGDEF)-like protein